MVPTQQSQPQRAMMLSVRVSAERGHFESELSRLARQHLRRKLDKVHRQHFPWPPRPPTINQPAPPVAESFFPTQWIWTLDQQNSVRAQHAQRLAQKVYWVLHMLQQM